MVLLEDLRPIDCINQANSPESFKKTFYYFYEMKGKIARPWYNTDIIYNIEDIKKSSEIQKVHYMNHSTK